MAQNGNRKRSSSGSMSKSQLYSLLCFIVLILTAVVWSLAIVLRILEVETRLVGILQMVKDLALWAAISLGAYGWAKKLGRAWFIVYCILVVLTLFCLLFGGLGDFGIIKI